MAVAKRELSADIWLEEYQAFCKMGLSLDEIARAFGYSMDTLKHRMHRCGLEWPTDRKRPARE